MHFTSSISLLSHAVACVTWQLHCDCAMFTEMVINNVVNNVFYESSLNDSPKQCRKGAYKWGCSRTWGSMQEGMGLIFGKIRYMIQSDILPPFDSILVSSHCLVVSPNERWLLLFFGWDEALKEKISATLLILPYQQVVSLLIVLVVFYQYPFISLNTLHLQCYSTVVQI